MTALEQQLLQLGREVVYPPAPDLVQTVASRIAERRAWGFPISRRALAATLVALAVGAGAAMAVPPARTAILEWLGLRGVSIQRVPTLPEASIRRTLDLGDRVTLAEARRIAGRSVPLPQLEGLGEPDAVFVDRLRPGVPVSLLYGSLERPRLLLSQYRGDLLFDKLAGPGTQIESVDVNGGRGVWLSGKEHVFVYVDEFREPYEETSRLAGNTLVWERGELLLRLEADISKKDALEIARSVG